MKILEFVLNTLFTTFLLAFSLLCTMLASTITGAIIGWSVGLFLDGTILGIFAALGISGFKMWQIGAFLGFVGGFFRSIQPTPKKNTTAQKQSLEEPDKTDPRSFTSKR